jgi:hypothetical protein
MKIGIFGDSFGFKPGFVSTDAFWVDVIQEKHNITNYNKPGTNLYWSYTMLEKYASQFDFLILTVTGPCRFYVPQANSPKVKHVVNLRFIEDLLKNQQEFDIGDISILKALQQYTLHALDLQQQALYHSLLVEKISNKFSNILLIPSFKGCMDPVTLFTKGTVTSETTMGDIAEIDMKYCGETWESIRLDKRNSHLSSENNIIFGREVLKYIEGDRNEPFEIDLSLYKKPTMSKNAFREIYFEPFRFDKV